MNKLLHFIILVFLMFTMSTLNADIFIHKKSHSIISHNGKYIVDAIDGDCESKVNAKLLIYSRKDGRKHTYLTKYSLGTCYLPSEVIISNNKNLFILYGYSFNKYKPIIEIYNIKNKKAKQFKLSDIYTSIQVSKMPTSVSAIHWKCVGLMSRIINEYKVEIHDSIGGLIKLDINTNKYSYIKNPYATCKIIGKKDSKKMGSDLI